jgi:hypothetical protein
MNKLRKLIPLLALPLLLACLLANCFDTRDSAAASPNPCSRDCSSGTGLLSISIFGRAI